MQRGNKRNQGSGLHKQGIPISGLNQSSKTKMHLLINRVIKPIEQDMTTKHKL